ncbi:MAG: methylmalonyl-CoA mutase family protein [Thermoplasmata archaeon]
MSTERRIRVLIAKPGLDGHDVGAKVVAYALREAGMEVIYTGLHQTVDQIINTALQEDVDVIGLSILSGAHLPITEKLMAGLRKAGAGDITVIVGGNIPKKDHEALRAMGAAAVFPTGTRFDSLVEFLRNRVGGEMVGASSPPPPHKVETPVHPAPSSKPVEERKSGEKVRPVILESGIEVKPVYGPEDLKGFDPASELGKPGEFPFTRGIHPLMYRARPYTMRQYAGFGTPRETNERFKFLLSQGQNALNVAFSLHSQMGIDSDDPLAEGEVGRVGMAVDTLKDMEIAFDGIPIDKISTSLTINGSAAIMIAMYLAMAEKRGVPLSEVRGTAQNDILKEYIGRGTWIFPVEPSIRLIADTIEFCSKHAPRYYPVSVCGYHIRESGANPVQEISYAYCIARAYIRAVMERGLHPDEFVPRFSFNFDIHGNIFEQVAKFRAARRLWAKLMRDEFGCRNPESMKMKMIAGGGGGGLTIEEPENNIVRGAYYALISALSGTQTMALCSYDEAYTIPSKKAALISLRTMQILVEEMGLADTVDPLGGSYYVEWLTGEMEKRIVETMRDVDARGGIVKLISEGAIQREVSRQAYLLEKKLQSGELVKVGVNKYRQEAEAEERKVEIHEYNPQAAMEKIQELRKLKAHRDNAAVRSALERIREKAATSENLMPYIMDAVKLYATVGEITAALKDVFGTFKEPVNL